MSEPDPSSAAVRWGRGGAIALYVATAILYAASFNTGYSFFIAILCLVLAQCLLVFIHEAGHALAGWLFGWRIILFAARPFVIQFPNRNIAWLRETHEPGIGGMVLAIPRTKRQDTRRAAFWLSAGGPLANVLASALAFATASSAAAFDTRYVLYSHLVFAVGIHSAAMCLTSLLPGASGLWSDGQSLRQNLKPRAENAAELQVIGYLGAILKYKLRLKALPEWMLAEARAIAATTPEVNRYLETIEIGRLLDTIPVDAAAARARIDAFEAQYGDSCWLACCDAYLAAIWEKDLAHARARLPQRAEPDELQPLYLAAAAAIAARAGDRPSAKRLTKQMRKAMRAQSPLRDPTFDDIRRQVDVVADECGWPARRTESLGYG